MKIIIISSNLKDSKRKIEELFEGYEDKIKQVRMLKNEIEFINGDKIKLVSKHMIDGLRSDVAIGEYADIITFSSKHEKPVWEYSDLENYLKLL